MKTTVTKEITFDMAHRLSFHEGKCKNIHGHTYKLQATFEADVLKNGLVEDFYNINMLLKNLTDAVDHSIMLYNGNEANMAFLSILKQYDMKIVETDYEPTAENIAKEIFESLSKRNTDRCRVIKVRLYETPTSYAEVIK